MAKKAFYYLKIGPYPGKRKAIVGCSCKTTSASLKQDYFYYLTLIRTVGCGPFKSIKKIQNLLSLSEIGTFILYLTLIHTARVAFQKNFQNTYKTTSAFLKQEYFYSLTLTCTGVWAFQKHFCKCQNKEFAGGEDRTHNLQIMIYSYVLGKTG